MNRFRLFFRDSPPVPQIHAYEVAELGSVQGDEHLITATCINDTEVDYWIDGLIKNLNEVRRAAKTKLAA